VTLVRFALQFDLKPSVLNSNGKYNSVREIFGRKNRINFDTVGATGAHRHSSQVVTYVDYAAYLHY